MPSLANVALFSGFVLVSSLNVRGDLIVAPEVSVIGAIDSGTSLVQLTVRGIVPDDPLTQDAEEIEIAAFSFSVRGQFQFDSSDLATLTSQSGLAQTNLETSSNWQDFNVSVSAFAVGDIANDVFGTLFQVYGTANENKFVSGSGVIAKMNFAIANSNLTNIIETGDFLSSPMQFVTLPSGYSVFPGFEFGFFTLTGGGGQVMPNDDVSYGTTFVANNTTAVPEPSSVALFAISGCGAGLHQWRKRRKMRSLL